MVHKSAFACLAALVLAADVVIPAGAAQADSIRAQEWHIAFLDLDQAQRISKGEGVTVAVIDSGVDASHPDLAGNVLPGEVTYRGPGRKGDASQDSNGHGTGVAGDIAAHGHGSGVDGALGIAPGAKILPIANTSDSAVSDGDANEATAAGIDYAIQEGSQVISISESITPGLALNTAIQRAENAGAIVVAAAGNLNDGDLSVAVPARLPGVIAVASIDRNGNHYPSSVTGQAILLSAPGVEIVHPAPGGGYAKGTGTSDAAAIVAGAVALVRSKYPNLSATEVIHRLTATATDKGPPGRDNEYGYGVINIVAALTADVPPLSASPAPSPTANDQPTGGNQQTSSQPPVKRSGTPTAAIVIAVVAVLVLFAVIGLALSRRRRT